MHGVLGVRQHFWVIVSPLYKHISVHNYIFYRYELLQHKLPRGLKSHRVVLLRSEKIREWCVQDGGWISIKYISHIIYYSAFSDKTTRGFLAKVTQILKIIITIRAFTVLYM